MKKLRILISFTLLSLLWICCTPEKGQGQQNKALVPKQKEVVAPISAAQDEAAFRKVFSRLKSNLSQKKVDEVSSLLHFPFYTSQAEANSGAGAAADPIKAPEFANYKKAIFNPDVIRLLPHCKEENLSEIDEKTDEAYYKSLKKITDPGSKMYEAYIQYPEKNTQAESYFAFVFGRVNGQFKAIATYAKWPVK